MQVKETAEACHLNVVWSTYFSRSTQKKQKEQFDELCEVVRLLVPDVTYSISMFYGCHIVSFG